MQKWYVYSKVPTGLFISIASIWMKHILSLFLICFYLYDTLINKLILNNGSSSYFFIRIFFTILIQSFQSFGRGYKQDDYSINRVKNHGGSFDKLLYESDIVIENWHSKSWTNLLVLESPFEYDWEIEM